MNSHNPPEVRVTPTGATAVTDLPGVDAADTAESGASAMAAAATNLTYTTVEPCRAFDSRRGHHDSRT